MNAKKKKEFKKNSNEGLAEINFSGSFQNLDVRGEINYEKYATKETDKNLEVDSIFEHLYLKLKHYKVDIFCALTVNQVIASAENGFLTPQDNKSWNDTLLIYTVGSLQKYITCINGPFVFARVPTNWLLYCLPSVDLGNDLSIENLTFSAKFSNLLPFNEIISYFVLSEQKREIDILFKTYNYEIEYLTIDKWLKKSNIDSVFYNRTSIDKKRFDRYLGGITLGTIVEIYGKLIDKKQIPFGNRYIEPFTCYSINIDGEIIKPNIVLIGEQGYDLLFCLESVLKYGIIGNTKNIESNYIQELRNFWDSFNLVYENEIDKSKTVLWVTPLIIRHSEQLSNCNASEFQKELEQVLKLNGTKTDVEIQWPLILFAGFAACALSDNMWTNSQEGIIRSGDMINKLKESVSDFLNLPIHKRESDILLTKTREIYSSIRKIIESFEYQKVVDVVNSINQKDKILFTDVLSAMCILWVTDTMSTDWNNVFNRAYNSRMMNLSKIFPILGTWMGFLHGFRMIDKRKNYKFSNADYLENLSINTIKSMFNKTYSFSSEKESLIRLSNISKGSDNNSLFVAKFKNSIELPVIINYDTRVDIRKKELIRKLNFKYNLFKESEKELEREIFNIMNLFQNQK